MYRATTLLTSLCLVAAAAVPVLSATLGGDCDSKKALFACEGTQFLICSANTNVWALQNTCETECETAPGFSQWCGYAAPTPTGTRTKPTKTNTKTKTKKPKPTKTKPNRPPKETHTHSHETPCLEYEEEEAWKKPELGKSCEGHPKGFTFCDGGNGNGDLLQCSSAYKWVKINRCNCQLKQWKPYCDLDPCHTAAPTPAPAESA
ncbi:hypothetical protein DFJ77DRAFT_456218 [Powellomyces hirtus]|nr:hypothetical protein DFJ77DRAFT_456218 [Powellomyces hirtus]